MGCDIHAAIEFRNSTGKWEAVSFPNRYFGKWDDEPEKTYRLDMNRNYDVFAILANVRNGSGFAGCDTGDGFEPMTDGRGLPDDISFEARESGCTGEHSETWCSLTEILAYDWTRKTKLRGWINAVEFEKWNRMKEWNPWPESWCGGISGGDVVHVSAQEMEHIVKEVVGTSKHFGGDYTAAIERLTKEYGGHYCLIEWEVGYMDCAKDFWVSVMPTMLKLGVEYGTDNVRLVMNFDS